MNAILCDICKQPCESEYFDENINKAYRFKGSFVYIRSRRFGKDTEVEEAEPTYDICKKCYDKLKAMCKVDKDGE